MTPPLALAASLALQAPFVTFTGTVGQSYPHSLEIRLAAPVGLSADPVNGREARTVDAVHVGIRYDKDDATRCHRWDGAPLYVGDLEPGTRIRVEAVGDFYGAHYAGMAALVIVGPPAEGPDFHFTAAQEAWVAPTDKETRALVHNLASRSGAVRERATREVGAIGLADRARAAGLLRWAAKELAKDPEGAARVAGLRRALWADEDGDGESGR